MKNASLSDLIEAGRQLAGACPIGLSKPPSRWSLRPPKAIIATDGASCVVDKPSVEIEWLIHVAVWVQGLLASSATADFAHRMVNSLIHWVKAHADLRARFCSVAALLAPFRFYQRPNLAEPDSEEPAMSEPDSDEPEPSATEGPESPTPRGPGRYPSDVELRREHEDEIVGLWQAIRGVRRGTPGGSLVLQCFFKNLLPEDRQ